jgi:hypothetical protein
MGMVLRIVDQTPGQGSVIQPDLNLSVECVTARTIITRRVEAEVAAINSGAAVRSSHIFEHLLNEPRGVTPRTIDTAQAASVAIEAFSAKRFVLLLDGKQIIDLDIPLILTPTSEARFLRLVPLVGG